MSFQGQEIELAPAAASPLAHVSIAQHLHRNYGLATPVSGSATARMELNEFLRSAELLAMAAEA